MLKRTAIASFLEMLFFILSGIYFFWLISLTTQFMLPYPEWMENVLLWTMSITAVLRLFFVGFKKKEPWIGLGIAAVYCLTFWRDGYSFLLFLAILTVGYTGIDYRKILRLFVSVASAVVCTAIIAGITGGIVDYTYFREGIRSSLGMNYPTDVSSMILFILLALWILRDKTTDLFMLLAGVGSALFSRFLTQSRTSLICSLVFIAAVIYEMLIPTVCERSSVMKRIRKGIYWLSSVAFPLYALLFFGAMFLYQQGTGLGGTLNTLLSSRVGLSVDAVQRYGLHPFGTPFEMTGAGSSLIAVSEYDFVDSSYPLILLRYGWVMLIVISVLFCWMARKAIRHHNGRIVLAMGIIALHALSEHHVMDVGYNILLVVPLASFSRMQETGTEKPVRRDRSTCLAKLTLSIICVLLVLFGLPAFLTGLRTVLQIWKVTGGGDRGWACFGIVFGLLAVMAVGLFALYHLLRWLFDKMMLRKAVEKNHSRWGIAFLLCAGVFAAYLICANHGIQNEVKEMQQVLAEEQEALTLAAESAHGQVYSEVLPSVYRSYLGVTENSILSGEELARYPNTTVLMEIRPEYRNFFNCGFLYTEISEKHALYTNDQGVVSAFMDAGYHVTGYYNTEAEIDLAYEAELNDLVFSPDTGLELDGVEHTLFFGTGLVLFSGKYTVAYELELPEGIPLDDTAACTLRISSNWGEAVQVEQTILRSQFDENRKLTVPIAVDYGTDTTGIEFLVKTAEGQKVNVHRISYVRTPDYDVHYRKDSRFRTISETYYDLHGEPAVTFGGYTRITYLRDVAGNIIEERYYDAAEKPVNIGMGYASLRREYDAEGRLMLTYYYDINGSPVECGSSYFHTYLQSLMGRDITVFFSIKDEGTASLTEVLIDDLHTLGLQTDLTGKNRCSFLAVSGPAGVMEQLDQNPVEYEGLIDGIPYFISSAGYTVGNYSSIQIGGIEYSKNTRGFNIVVFDHEKASVVESVSFDTHTEDMKVTR